MKLCPRKNLSLPSKAPRSVLPSIGNDFDPSCEVRATVPETSGKLITRLTVGSITPRVVSLEVSVAPSNTKLTY